MSRSLAARLVVPLAVALACGGSSTPPPATAPTPTDTPTSPADPGTTAPPAGGPATSPGATPTGPGTTSVPGGGTATPPAGGGTAAPGTAPGSGAAPVGGDVRWFAFSAAEGNDANVSITVDDAGFVWVAGVVPTGMRVAKYDRKGALQWERRFAAPGRTLSSRALTPAPGGGVFLGFGYPRGSTPVGVDLGGGELRAGGVVRLDAKGVWVSQFDAFGVVQLASRGEWLAVSAGFPPSQTDVFDAAGKFVFAGARALPVTAPAFMPDGTLVVGYVGGARPPGDTSAGSIAGFGPTGQLWRCGTSAYAGRVLALGNDAVAWGAGELVVTEVPSCRERFRVRLDHDISSLLPLQGGGVVALGGAPAGGCARARATRLDPAGKILWTKTLPAGDTTCGEVQILDGAVGADGDIVAVGRAVGRTDFGGGAVDAGPGDGFLVDLAP